MRPDDLLWRQGFPIGARPQLCFRPAARPLSPASNPATPARTGPEDGQRPGGQTKAERNADERPRATARPAAKAGGRGPASRPTAGPRGQPAASPQAGEGVRQYRRSAAASPRTYGRSYATLVVFLRVDGPRRNWHSPCIRSGRLAGLMADLGLNDVTAYGKAQSGSNPVQRPPRTSRATRQPARKQSPVNPCCWQSALPPGGRFQLSEVGSLAPAEERVSGLVCRADQGDGAARQRAERRKAIAKYLADAMVALRRKHVSEALSASPPAAAGRGLGVSVQSRPAGAP